MPMMTYFGTVVLWGFIATCLMTTIMIGAQGLGYSRLSLPFLFGTAVTDRLREAYLYGYILYGLGGWAFAFVYDAVFRSLDQHSWWAGTCVGFLHGIFLLGMLMHLPLIHPRMASDYDRPRVDRAIEPPGFFGVYYGRQTPAVTLFAHAIYGLVLGATLSS